MGSHQYKRGDPSAAYAVHDINNEISDDNDEQDDDRMAIHDENQQHNNDDDEGESSMN